MPTPGAPSGSVNDKLNGAFFDNGDGTYTMHVGGPIAADGVTTNPVVVVQAAQQVGNMWSTHNNSGTATAPAIAANISGSATASSGAGYYDIQFDYGYGGTAEATTANNFQLYLNGAAIESPLPAPIGTGSASQMFGRGIIMKRQLASGDVISIRNPVAGSAGAVYVAGVFLTRTS